MNPDEIRSMIENLEVAIVASDAHFNVIYANEKCRQIFKNLLNMENFVGRPMAECHKPETMEKLRKLYSDYQNRSRALDYYTMDIPGGKATIVNIPFYQKNVFAGVVEFIFESSLA